jgi:hypothetical protein
VAVSFSPFELAGTHSVSEYPWLHLPPAAAPVIVHRPNYSIIDEPQPYKLAQNFPNPFNPTTTINFTLSQSSIVTLKVYNILGQEVATLLDHTQLEDGEQTVDFVANNLASGVYFYKIVAQGIDQNGAVFTQVKRMLLMK